MVKNKSTFYLVDEFSRVEQEAKSLISNIFFGIDGTST